jgi:hypothetical protein
MYIIIENECIDTSIFTKMKLYEKSGIIAFIYKNDIDSTEVELPVTFDDAFQAEIFFDEIIDHFLGSSDSCITEARASVPIGLLAKIKRGMHIFTKPQREYDFDAIPDESKK